MIGPVGRGANIKIPAIFRNGNDYVEVDAAYVTIEHDDNKENKKIIDLPETEMQKFGVGQYYLNYTIPTYANPGNFIIKISYKPINGKNIVEGKKDTLVVTEEIVHSINNPNTNLISTNQSVQESFGHMDYELSDIVTDREGNPLAKVHINVFEKKNFKRKDPNNVKVGATMTDSEGMWRLRLPRGEYWFVYNAVDKKEYLEMRKIGS